MDTEKLFEKIFQHEGGFTPHRRSSTGARIDPDTLFGFTIDNFTRLIMSEPLDSMPNAVRQRVEAIRATPANRRAEEVRDLMYDVGRTLQPFSVPQTRRRDDGTEYTVRIVPEQPDHGRPLRATEHSLPNISPREQELQQGMRTLVTHGYQQRYISGPGFDDYPGHLSSRLVMFGINAGEGRARWALVQAMREQGLVEGDEPFPVLTSAQATQPANFSSSGPGYFYAQRACNNAIAQTLANATPEQMQSLGPAYDRWCATYYRQLASNPQFAPYLEGWMNRLRETANIEAADAVGLEPEVVPNTPDAPGAPPRHYATETAQVRAQFRDNGVGAIALDIPGHGVVQYDIDGTNNFSKINHAPENVVLLNAFDLQVDWNDSNKPINPYPFENTLTWVTNGERQYLPLQQVLNSEIRDAGITYLPAPVFTRNNEGEINGWTLQQDRGGIGRITFDLPGGHLPQNADVVRIFNHGRGFDVQDVDKHEGPPTHATPFPNAVRDITREH